MGCLVLVKDLLELSSACIACHDTHTCSESEWFRLLRIARADNVRRRVNEIRPITPITLPLEREEVCEHIGDNVECMKGAGKPM